MITITKATPDDFITIQQIAYQSWQPTYGAILSQEQIAYMLDLMYSTNALNINFTQKNYCFLLINEFETPLGFASYQHHYLDTNSTRLHKLYLLPAAKGKGLGKLMLEEVVKIAQAHNSDCISLNVNRFNKSYLFYQKMGFEIVAEEDLEIGNGYLMEDFKMELKL